MSALNESLSAIAHAAVSEANRSQRWVDPQIAEDVDELAARRRLRDETDRYPTAACFEAEALEDEQDRADSEGPF